MGCPCLKSKTKTAEISDTEINAIKIAAETGVDDGNDMARMVNFEGQMIQQNAIPQGSLYVKGVWYSSFETMPEEIKQEIRALYNTNSNPNSNSNNISSSK